MSIHDEFVKYPMGKIGKGGWCDSCGRFNARYVCVHALVVRGGKMLMIERKLDPMKGWWALPAGYLAWDETVEEGVLRELAEETGLEGRVKGLLGVYSAVDRDEDGRQNIAITYVVEVDEEQTARAGDDAERVEWFDLKELPEKIAFDHRQMIEDIGRI